MRQSRAQARYYPVDVTDPAELGQALAQVRSEWGPVTGLVHGAGVLADALIAAKTDDQFGRVFDTKVEGLRSVLAATKDDPLAVLCAFSSVAAQFGNPGQCDYAMANEVLNQVLSAEQARRPGCVVRAIGWGPWQGGMVTGELAGRFREAGVSLIDPDSGAAAFVTELGPGPDARVILSAGARVGPGAGPGPDATATPRARRAVRAGHGGWTRLRLPGGPPGRRRPGGAGRDRAGLVRRRGASLAPDSRPDRRARSAGSRQDLAAPAGGRRAPARRARPRGAPPGRAWRLTSI